MRPAQGTQPHPCTQGDCAQISSTIRKALLPRSRRHLFPTSQQTEKCKVSLNTRHDDCDRLRSGYHKADVFIIPQHTRSKNKVQAQLESCKTPGASIPLSALRDDKFGIRPILHISSPSNYWYLGPVLFLNERVKAG